METLSALLIRGFTIQMDSNADILWVFCLYEYTIEQTVY